MILQKIVLLPNRRRTAVMHISNSILSKIKLRQRWSFAAIASHEGDLSITTSHAD